MIKEYKASDLTWLDLQNPTADEIGQIMERYGVPEEAGEDLLSPTPKQRVEMYENCVYIVLHFPALRSMKNNDHRHEIDFIIGKKFLITVHYDSLRSVEKFSKSFEKNFNGENFIEDSNAGFIFHELIKHLYHSLLHDVEIIKDALRHAETSIFKGEEMKMVVELSRIHRDILRFKNAIIPHQEAIISLHDIFKKFLGEKYDYLVRNMSSEYKRVERRMQNNKDLLDELRLTNDSLLSTKQNDAMKILTMMAFITFPLTFIAALFTIPTESAPIVGMHYGFEIIVVMMIAVVIAILAFFRYKKWM